MRSGLMRKRVTIERATTTLLKGDAVKTWATLFEAWAEIRPLSARELFSANMTQAEVSHRISIRWRPGVTLTTKDRARIGTRLFDLTGVMNTDERNREWVLMAVERPNA